MKEPLLTSTFQLAGTGMALPSELVSSEKLDQRLGTPVGWLRKASGVATRYMCGHEEQVDLAKQASSEALADACVSADGIDLVIFAAAVSKQPIPSTAPLLARHLGIPPGRCTAFDVNSTCLSFLTGLDVAINLLGSGRFRGALIASAEIATRALPWETDPETAGLFGDGAASAVLFPAEAAATGSRLRAAHFETFHQGYEYCQLASGGTGIDFHREPERFKAHVTFRMDGHSLFKLTAKSFPAFVERVLDRAGWAKGDVDLVVPHQASPLALAHLVKRCGFPRERVINIVAEYGNQVAASIPVCLHLAHMRGMLRPGTKVLLLGTSAGVSFGGMAIEV